MVGDWKGKIRRGLKKPPSYIIERLFTELKGPLEKRMAPRRARRLDAASLSERFGCRSVSELWLQLAGRSYLAETQVTIANLEQLCPGEPERIFKAADAAMAHHVNLLGSGVLALGDQIDWHKDYKSGHRWSPAYCRDIDYYDPDSPCDVKFPWEVSRMQWMVPLAQAYLLSKDEHYAQAALELLESWIRENPYAHSVNWACTMDVALRILSWSWFFHAFKASKSWEEQGFRERFLKTLYLHGDFTARHLEKSDISGNHYTADAAGLVFAGLFFGEPCKKWLALGWSILEEELPRQVYPDGVDFEASIPYHRLVQELFLFPALYRMRQGLGIPAAYRERLLAMARFTAAYARCNGSVPLWGDADDARALPFGGQALNDHRYLIGVTGLAFQELSLLRAFSGMRAESFWLQGFQVASRLPLCEEPEQEPRSSAFPAGGFYLMRNRLDHVFVDCGPLGLAGRGGHGHNDLLSFEAMLAGVPLISDCGAYLYTADFHERNRFRSTAYHNTPQVDGEEINRFVGWNYLWSFHNDARHELLEQQFGIEEDLLVVSHSGFQRLASPVALVRRFKLNHRDHCLTISDDFQGKGDHELEIPLHLATELEVCEQPDQLLLKAGDKVFKLDWSPRSAWQLDVRPCRISPSYGVVLPSMRLTWTRKGSLVSFELTIKPYVV